MLLSLAHDIVLPIVSRTGLVRLQHDTFYQLSDHTDARSRRLSWKKPILVVNRMACRLSFPRKQSLPNSNAKSEFKIFDNQTSILTSNAQALPTCSEIIFGTQNKQ